MGKIVDGIVHPSREANFVSDAWNDLPRHYPHANLDKFVVMPNHVHGIIIIVGRVWYNEIRVMYKQSDHPLQVCCDPTHIELENGEVVAEVDLMCNGVILVHGSTQKDKQAHANTDSNLSYNQSMNKRKLLQKILSDSKNIRFSEIQTCVESFGFHLSRVSGSHHIYTHPDIPELINLQEVKGKAKPYQIKQFLKIIESYNLQMKE
ncbi:MAG: type II toxin-antitoxin system HicA family toxin [Anaerolineaceae bacterium]|nr:type II toxin-antitoxin system HicA family toxin [Anaerolineaceae bacterium]